MGGINSNTYGRDYAGVWFRYESGGFGWQVNLGWTGNGGTDYLNRRARISTQFGSVHKITNAIGTNRLYFLSKHALKGQTGTMLTLEDPSTVNWNLTTNPDPDGDGVHSAVDPNPVVANSPPNPNTDSDADGITDALELSTSGTDPRAADSDGDARTDVFEAGTDGFATYPTETNPQDPDTDRDGVNDKRDKFPTDPTRT